MRLDRSRRKRRTNEVRQHALYAPDEDQEEKELDNLGQLYCRIQDENYVVLVERWTDAIGVLGTTLIVIFVIEQVVDPSKDDIPAGVGGCRIEGRFGSIFDRVVYLDTRLDGFRYVAPDSRNKVVGEDGNHVDYHC